MEQENRVSTNLNTNSIDPISFFGEDANFVFVYKKTEKLVSAVYMVTNLFSENEPTKWTLRKKAGDLMSFILNYKDINESSCGDFIYNVKTRILELVSLLEISSFGGFKLCISTPVLANSVINSVSRFSAAVNLSRRLFKINVGVELIPILLP